MNDQELFEFFKSKSGSFDEVPPEELWQKISARKRRKWYKPQSSKLFLTVLLFAVIVIFLICLTILFFERK